MKVFEMLGLPGSGKSTLLPNIKKNLEEYGHDVYLIQDLELLWVKKRYSTISKILTFTSLRKKLFYFTNSIDKYKVEFLTEYAALYNHVSEHIQKNNPSNKEAKLVKHWFVELGGYYMLGKQLLSDDEILFFDEGFYQRIISIFTSKTTTVETKHVSGYIELAPAVDKVYLVDVTTEESLKRMIKRGMTTRLKEANEEELSMFYETSAELIDYCRGFKNIQIVNN
jgi:thymidylate kinase